MCDLDVTQLLFFTKQGIYDGQKRDELVKSLEGKAKQDRARALFEGNLDAKSRMKPSIFALI